MESTVDKALQSIDWKSFKAESLDEAYDFWLNSPHEGSWQFVLDAFNDFVVAGFWTDP